MPNIVVRLPAGLLDERTRSTLVDGINAAAAECERIPPDPVKRALCWVVIDEIAAGHWTCGGRDPLQAVIPVMVSANVPAGVLDDVGRAQYARLLHQAVTSALPGEQRRIATSCMINDVADGTWGVNGRIWRLPQMAAAAGFEHLQHLAQAN
ncbi:MAG: 4-oxalocrotonate tautomerase family protein [Bradyrhizobium sp.]|uniref:tautomerase family protein n=1 Tax=Bradyrhizobium sp. TaxID=376 RepID=UPI003D1159DE